LLRSPRAAASSAFGAPGLDAFATAALAVRPGFTVGFPFVDLAARTEPF